ncbi:MAG: hypothetical protein IKN49_05850 [Elusimicrobiaceae bacterium]|nr:hypothetical protein [Elusimicrobiaceae bacterium]
MKTFLRTCQHTLHSRQAQILLPAVMLAPIFILVIYLLFETSKLSMTKVRQQFALDNAAYAQMSTASTYLNATAMVNGIPYRVMRTMSQTLKPKKTSELKGNFTVFDVFYRAGAFLSIGPNHADQAISNPIPAAASTNWDFQYYGDKRKNWIKEEPSDANEDMEEKKDDGGKYLVLADKEIVDNYFFTSTNGALDRVKDYIVIFIRTGSIYASQNYAYKDTIKKSRMFREAIFLNTKDCRKSECGQQGAAVLDRFELNTVPFEIERGRFYLTADYVGSTAHSGAYPLDLDFNKIIKTKLFQFGYLDASSRSRLKQLARGITLKQKYVVPENRFNINITARYKPYVKNTVSVTCPRSGNNCVWPNPLPKYSVKVGV